MTLLPEVLSGITVTSAPVPFALDGVTSRGVLWQASEESFLLNVPDVARYLVQAGGSITIDPVPGASERLIGHHLGMLPLAALQYQRGFLAMHAAALTDGNGAILLAGDSGSGKSTLLAAMLLRGWRMLGDDLAIIGTDASGMPTVHPARCGVALWPISLERLGIESASLPFCDVNRREFSQLEHFEKNSQPLRGIYRLSVHSKPETELDEIAANARFQATGSMLYNSHVADAVCSRVDYMRCVAAMAGRVPYRELKRPRGVWSLDALMDRITK